MEIRGVLIRVRRRLNQAERRRKNAEKVPKIKKAANSKFEAKKGKLFDRRTPLVRM